VPSVPSPENHQSASIIRISGSLSWYKIQIRVADLVTHDIYKDFSTAVSGLLKQRKSASNVTMFTEPEEIDGCYVFYLTPAAAENLPTLLDDYSAVKCDAPEVHRLRLAGGDAKWLS